MANPRKFSEKIALQNQKEAEETAKFEAIMREVSDVTNRVAGVAGVASASSSVGASPTGSGVSEPPLSVRSAGASPPQTSGEHLRINLSNQFRVGGSLPNVNNNANDTEKDSSPNSVAIHSVELKTALNNLEDMQHDPMMYRGSERSRSGGPIRSRPVERRHDTSPYSSGLYLSPPPPDTWRRTNSDSALHQSANEPYQSASVGTHRRDQHITGNAGNELRESRHGYMDRPRSSCEMPRVPGINIYPSSQPPGQQIPIGNNTGSLPDLSNVHFPPPLHTPLDQEEHSSSTQYSNSPQTSSPTTLSPTSLAQAGRLSFSQDHSPPSAQNHLSVPVNSRFLHTSKGVTLDNGTSTSQQDLQSYSQPPPAAPPTSRSPRHFVYQQSHGPVSPQSPKTQTQQQHHQHQHQQPQHPHQQQQQQQQQQFNSLGSYRTSQPVNRPSPQPSPSLTVQGSPLSYSNNSSAPPSPTGHPGPPNFTSENMDQNSYFVNQAQAAALQQHFEQFSMDWAQMVQQLGSATWTAQLEMDSPVASTTIGTYIGSPNHSSNFSQSDVINAGGELDGGDTGYYGTSPQLAYQPRTPTSTQHLTPQTPNTPTIIFTDFSTGSSDPRSPDFVKDLGSAMTDDLDPDLFPSDEVLREGLDHIDVTGLQMLTDPEMQIISDPDENQFRN